MTQYNKEVERQKAVLAAEAWGKKIKYMLAQDGILEVAYNNGEKHFEETATGKKWKTGVDYTDETLMEKFERYLSDIAVGRDPNGE